MTGLGQQMSTLSIMRTHSVARLSADVVTSNGCTTFSSSMLLTVPCNPDAHHETADQAAFKDLARWTCGSAQVPC